ncbi:hypothetical protein [Modestobacter sp. VKM Ac-2984]|uniref:hypothetical protein n=1 Tax=Modestobacter sp. VKM Ac-2984 TaxID=3004138 RepID=UPI0022AAE2B9|nr:hypothetical protein [Modestobacter sp. VKM Ac-2984]MCZ2817919.1 hypothetical protein [Modestobacter sp. VKM Ac-2984]
MVVGNPSFADELISQVLERGGPPQLWAEHSGPDFGAQLIDAAGHDGIAERLDNV